MRDIIEDTVSVELRDLTFEVEVAYLPTIDPIDPRDYVWGEIVSDRVIEVYYDQGYAEFPPETVKWLAEQHADEVLEELQELLL